MKIADKVFKVIIDVLFGTILIFLALLAGYSTSVIIQSEETIIIHDNLWLNLFVFTIVSLIASYIYIYIYI